MASCRHEPHVHERDPGASRALVSEGTRTCHEPAARGVVLLETLEPGHVRGSSLAGGSGRCAGTSTFSGCLWRHL